MDGQIGAAIEQRLLQLLGEQPLAARLGQSAILDAVARGLQDHDLDGAGGGEMGMGRDQAITGLMGLRQRQRAAARADAERLGRHAANF